MSSKLAQNIQRLRESKGYTQNELSYISGVTLSTLTKLESGVSTNPTIDTIVKIAEALKTDVDVLVSSDPFTFIDLFAGIGGIRIAFENVGGTCVFSSEFDKQCQVTYEENFGEKPHGDITKIDEKDIPDHTILTGGFPCQSFSIIGEQKGFADTRGTLFFDIERILKEKKPYAFLLENVKNLVSHDRGRTFATILSSLRSLGYYTHWKILNGLDYGVPQKRERIVIVGFKRNHPFKFPKPNKNRVDADSVLEDDAGIDKKYFLKKDLVERYQGKVKEIPSQRTIWHENKSGNIGVHKYSCALRASASYNYLTVNGYRRLTGREMLRLQGFPDSYKISVPYTQIRKQAGNSVVIPKIQAVAEEMIKAMNQEPINEHLEPHEVLVSSDSNENQLELKI